MQYSASLDSRADEVERCSDLFLAALRRVDGARAITGIEFDGTEYQWGAQASGHESLWVSSDGESLVDALMGTYPYEYYGVQLTLLGEGGDAHPLYFSFVTGGLTQAISSSGGSDIYLHEDITEDVVVASGSAAYVDGGGHTLRGSIVCESGSSQYLTVLELRDLTLDGDVNADGTADAEYAIWAVNRTQMRPDMLSLSLRDCTLENYRNGGAYITNASEVTVEGCSFRSVAGGPATGVADERTGALVLDLVNVDANPIRIADSSFEGACGSEAVIGVAVRGGESDSGADGMPSGTRTTLSKLVVTGCSFGCDGAKATVRLGVDSKADEDGAGAGGFAANGTGSFAAEVSGNKTAVTVLPAYRTYRAGSELYDTATGRPVACVELGVNGAASKVAAGDLVVSDPGEGSGSEPGSEPGVGPGVEPGVVTNPDGSVTTTVVAEDGTATATTVTPGGSSSVVVMESGGKVASVEVEVSAADAASGAVTLPLPGGVAVGQEMAVSLPKGSATVVVPVAGGASSSIAVVSVGAGGTETVLPKVAVAEGGLEVALDGDATLRLEDREASFPDVSGSEWYAGQGVIGFVTSRGIMGGAKLPDGTTEFRGDEGTDRAMFATMLHRLELEPEAGDASFTDVAEGDWYAGAAAWASSAGVVAGYPDGGFGGADAVTREQMAVMLYRYAAWLGLDTSARAALAFPDAGDVSGWAEEAMSWAVAEGLFSGSASTGELSPGDGATRAEAAAVVMRLVNNVLY